MSEIILNKPNVDSVTSLWMPDQAECELQEERRLKQEWLRKKTGVKGKRPSELGLHAYTHCKPLHPKFYEGRTPPRVAIDSMENLEWYEEQLKRCIYGYEYNGQRITGDYYWFLNFFVFQVAKKNSKGEVTKEFEMAYPYYSIIHDYIFKVIEEAHFLGKGVSWMAGHVRPDTMAT